MAFLLRVPPPLPPSTMSIDRFDALELFLMAFLLRVPPPLPPSTMSMSWSVSFTKPQVVEVRGSLAAALGLFLMVPPAGKSLSNPSSNTADPLSLRHPLLEDDLEDLENDLRKFSPLSSVPTGVCPELESLSLLLP